MEWATFADKWSAAPAYLGRKPEIPAAHHAWEALSQACHGHSYDVGLTAAELRAHLATADAFFGAVAANLFPAASLGASQ